ncbi:MAG TPA: TlpA family protein disulfide reductase [Chitinophagales bacterium]|nr:TlpA family protein disulfide reductase [Chitinophagales bacterium]
MDKSFFLVTAICCISFFAYAQNSVPVFDFTKYENRILHKNDTLYIVNFWATWCKPCIEELPIFEKVAQTYTQQPVKIILVSQDAKTRAVQVNDFLQKNKYTSESFILSAGNPNVWIDKIDSNWSGTIPMTLFYKNGNKIYFHEGDYETYDELEKIIHSKL